MAARSRKPARRRCRVRVQAPSCPGMPKTSESEHLRKTPKKDANESRSDDVPSKMEDTKPDIQVDGPVHRPDAGSRVACESHWEEQDWQASEQFCEGFYSQLGWQHAPKEAAKILEQQRLPCSREQAAAARLGLYLPTALLLLRDPSALEMTAR